MNLFNQFRHLVQIYISSAYCALKAAEAVFPFPVPDATRYSGHRSNWSQNCIRLAGINPYLVDEEPSRSDLGRLVTRVRRETFFDLSFRRPPRRARALLADTLSAVSARLKGRRDN